MINKIHKIIKNWNKQAEELSETHQVQEIKHEDGRQDVVIQVNRLNVDESTPEGKEAKRIIDEKIIPALAKRVSIVTLIDKETGNYTTCRIQTYKARAWAEAVIKDTGKSEKEFYVVEVELWDEGQQVRVSTLK